MREMGVLGSLGIFKGSLGPIRKFQDDRSDRNDRLDPLEPQLEVLSFVKPLNRPLKTSHTGGSTPGLSVSTVGPLVSISSLPLGSELPLSSLEHTGTYLPKFKILN